MNHVHIGWLIFVSVLLGICLCVLWIFFNINHDYIIRDFEHSQNYVWLEKQFFLLRRLFKGYMIQNKHEKFFIPNCFLIQSEDHALNFTDAKDGIDVELMEKKNDR
jgi:hypothetical protein